MDQMTICILINNNSKNFYDSNTDLNGFLYPVEHIWWKAADLLDIFSLHSAGLIKIGERWIGNTQIVQNVKHGFTIWRIASDELNIEPIGACCYLIALVLIHLIETPPCKRFKHVKPLSIPITELCSTSRYGMLSRNIVLYFPLRLLFKIAEDLPLQHLFRKQMLCHEEKVVFVYLAANLIFR